MLETTLPLVAVAFVVAFLLVMSAGLLLFSRPAVLDRLSDVITPASGKLGLLARLRQLRPEKSVANFVTPFEKMLPRSPEEVSVIQKRLIRAGYRKDAAVGIFYGCKVFVPLALAGLATVTRAYEYGPFFIYAVALGVGFLLPDFVLGNRISNRQLEIRLGLPDALDLMVICIEAGLGLDQALQRVADELRISHPEISDELGVAAMEQRAGRPRAEAWKHLAERTDVDAIRAVVASLVQADQYGTSVSKGLRVHAETLRTRRRQQVEEEAAKTAVKLVFPLVFCIFPSLFVVALGPAMIKILESFGNVTLIRVVAGVLFVIVLFILIQRRRKRVR
jgi:tight adherence protein C